MASSAQSMQHNRLMVEAKIKSLINNDLKEICRGENLAVSGVKAQLQSRILDHLAHIIAQGDVHGFERMRHRVSNHGSAEKFASPSSNFGSASISPAPNRSMAAAYNRPGVPHFGARPSYPPSRGLQFKDSPFYHNPEPITPPQDLTEMQSNRHTVNMPLTLSASVCDRLKANEDLRIMIYCAAASGLAPFAKVDISFPNQIEIKVNGDDVKSNFKGLKNKPGTTKPADITDLVRKAHGYNNSLQITYALTTKKYTVVINLVDKRKADQLAKKLAEGKQITKAKVLEEMRVAAEDTDIVTTSTVMSLKDPISTMRITMPCRSTVCTHNQCFDGSNFLQLQEQAPTWTCPVCNKTILYETLAVDQYVKDILQNTSSSTEQVTIEPDGQWRPVVQGEDQSNGRGKPQIRASYDNDSDDDIIEIQDSRLDKIKAEAPSVTPGIAQQTPPLSSREPSMVASARSNKRPSAVIDLTLSDDDDEPPRPAKRMHTSQPISHHSPTSLPEARFTDIGTRQSGSLAQGFPDRFSNGFSNSFPVDRRDTLPPLQLGQVNGGLQNGQRLPWPAEPNLPAVQHSNWASGAYRDGHGSYSHSLG